MKLFSTAEVAKILDLPKSRVHSFVRAGFIAPSRDRQRQLQFTFQDLLILKTTKGLLNTRLSPKIILRMLASLKRQLPDDQHLSRIKIYADGKRIVARDGKARWRPESGQFVFDFDAQTLARQVKLSRPAPKERKPDVRAVDWFNRAVELESSSCKEAQHAYHRALEIDPKMADAHLNLGRLYHGAKDWDKAQAHYEAAARHALDDPAPLFNLGVLAQDRERLEEALRAYRQAIARDPLFADAHYNLGLLLEALGKKAEAISHLHTARKIYLKR
ncbi:MAG: tetratricopeptide repeat protein [Deltaproteobacteria bacterium]|nr:tetratricopeptide repeat protein [Deltaproteobacteria bacterium]